MLHPPPSTRRAYGGRKDQRNVLRSRFPYQKVQFYAPAERLFRTLKCVEPLCGRAFPRQLLIWPGPCHGGTMTRLSRGSGVCQSSSYLLQNDPLTRRLAPTPPVHVREHRVVEAEDHLPLPVEHRHVAQRHRVRYAPLPTPSVRRAYGGRKDQRNVLRSRIPYRKLHFYAPSERLKNTMSCLCGSWESVPASAASPA